MIKYLIKQTIKFILHIFWLLPISKKKIFFSSFKGTTISCNPYYICEELLKRNSDFKIVWCCNNPESFNPFNEQDVTFVKFNSLKYIIEQMTSRILVNNGNFPTWIPFRLKKQILIDTWHGGGAYKKVAASEIKTKEAEKRERISARNTSYWGFSIAENNDELKLAIENFNQNEYESAVKKNHEYFGSYEKGHASEAIVDKILQLF